MADEDKQGSKPEGQIPANRRSRPRKKKQSDGDGASPDARTHDAPLGPLDAPAGRAEQNGHEERQAREGHSEPDEPGGPAPAADGAGGPSHAESIRRRTFPIIGIGSSAGGLEALEEFFKNVPEDSEMAYIIVSHTDPARSSLLPDIIRRRANIPVTEVSDGITIEPNVVYLPPSNRDLVLEGDRFRLKEQQRNSMPRLPIDSFFKSLAESGGEQACCVILSGTGTDGAQGLRVIKEKGGVTVVQSIESAMYRGMPESAVATSLADFVLRPSEMPERLIECFSTDAGMPKPEEAEPREDFPSTLSKIITTISNRIGHDFSAYKKSTLIRRIQRRMVVTRIGSPQKYLNYLHHNPGEIEFLFQDLLIGVTSFFRDPESFDLLKKEILPDLLTRRPASEPFRVWAAGCATGEEVYSIVMLVMECLEEIGVTKEIQAFGTDLDHSAVEKARDGLYPENIVADVSPGRLQRFFEEEDTSYRVRKEIREPVVFAAHNLLKDPPFSRLDLLMCRNLLIYLEPKAQKKTLPLFHYALRPGGVLFLGASETVGEFTDLFTPIHKKWSMYRRVDVSPALQPIVEFPTGGTAPPAPLERAPMGPPQAEVNDAALADATTQLLLEMHTPACVVVNRRGEINFIHGRTGKYLEPAPGRISVNIIDMAREGLRFELASALRKVAATGETVRREGLRVKTNGDFQDFNLTMKPLGKSDSLKNMIVVLFEEIPPPRKKRLHRKKSDCGPDAVAQRTGELEREIAKLQQDHRITLEELETSNEELKSVNEELQSSNEELQSTNEELESSREELQSLNEELSTVNAELHEKIVELSQSYDTINHVLNSTGVAILFVDRELNVQRFTREATGLINLIDADIGRSLTHISTNLDYDSFLEDVRRALVEQKTIDREMRARDGRWYSARIVPYVEPRGRLNGVVITFFDVDRMKGALRRMDEAGLG